MLIDVVLVTFANTKLLDHNSNSECALSYISIHRKTLAAIMYCKIAFTSRRGASVFLYMGMYFGELL